MNQEDMSLVEALRKFVKEQEEIHENDDVDYRPNLAAINKKMEEFKQHFIKQQSQAIEHASEIVLTS